MSVETLSRLACMACAQVKSYLTGNPGITLALNDSLVIGRREGGANDYGGYGRGADAVMLDDCNFHQSVSLDRHAAPPWQSVPHDASHATCSQNLQTHAPACK